MAKPLRGWGPQYGHRGNMRRVGGPSWPGRGTHWDEGGEWEAANPPAERPRVWEFPTVTEDVVDVTRPEVGHEAAFAFNEDEREECLLAWTIGNRTDIPDWTRGRVRELLIHQPRLPRDQAEPEWAAPQLWVGIWGGRLRVGTPGDFLGLDVPAGMGRAIS